MIGITYFLAIMGQIGTIELAISNIAFRIYNISIMPAFGVGAACGAIVGFYLGENKSEKSWIWARYARIFYSFKGFDWISEPVYDRHSGSWDNE